MTSGELAALITAFGVSLAGIITAVAALRGSNYSAQKMKDLETSVARLQTENDRLRADNQQAHLHMNVQDTVILDQTIKIEKWHDWGQRMGQALNQLQLENGALTQQVKTKPRTDKHQTGPLPPLLHVTAPLAALEEPSESE